MILLASSTSSGGGSRYRAAWMLISAVERGRFALADQALASCTVSAASNGNAWRVCEMIYGLIRTAQLTCCFTVTFPCALAEALNTRAFETNAGVIEIDRTFLRAWHRTLVRKDSQFLWITLWENVGQCRKGREFS